jgi:hypothetical protein
VGYNVQANKALKITHVHFYAKPKAVYSFQLFVTAKATSSAIPAVLTDCVTVGSTAEQLHGCELSAPHIMSASDEAAVAFRRANLGRWNAAATVSFTWDYENTAGLYPNTLLDNMHTTAGWWTNKAAYVTKYLALPHHPAFVRSIHSFKNLTTLLLL